MEISLDRFSQPLSGERFNIDHGNMVDMEGEKPRCEGCGHILYFGEEEIIETEWMDEFIHDHEGCKKLYIEKEQRANATPFQN